MIAGRGRGVHRAGGTQIQSYTLWRSAQVLPSADFKYFYALWEGKVDNDHIVDACAGNVDGKPGCSSIGTTQTPLAASNRVQRSNLSGVGRIWLAVMCRDTYRFTRTVGVQTYRLRARVRAHDGYPFATGASRALRVRVRG